MSDRVTVGNPPKENNNYTEPELSHQYEAWTFCKVTPRISEKHILPKQYLHHTHGFKSPSVPRGLSISLVPDIDGDLQDANNLLTHYIKHLERTTNTAATISTYGERVVKRTGTSKMKFRLSCPSLIVPGYFNYYGRPLFRWLQSHTTHHSTKLSLLH